MLTATQISAALKDSLSEGYALIIVSGMEWHRQSSGEVTRLLVKDDGRLIGGTLGKKGLDEIAARYARALAADEKEEIVVARAGDFEATPGFPACDWCPYRRICPSAP